jgi:hypothetical protein
MSGESQGMTGADVEEIMLKNGKNTERNVPDFRI